MKHTILLGLTILFFTSCQKVIKVDLNAADPQFVIEANLHEGSHDFKVRITKTTSYFSSGGTIPVVNNASVTLQDKSGITKTLLSTGDGWYELANYTAVNNTTYKLTVIVDGNTFSADSYMPISPKFDSLSYKEFGGIFGGGSIDPYLMTAHFQDSLSVNNFYRIIVTKNDSLQNEPFDLYLLDDKIRDGQYINAPIFSAFCDIGDTMDIEMLSMDENVYDYYITLSDILTGDANNSAAPANPNTNFTNGALGYFGAFSSTKKSLRIIE